MGNDFWCNRPGAKNLVALPNRAGKEAGVGGKRVLHWGDHLDEYFDKIYDRLDDLRKQHLAGEITDAEAKAKIAELVAEMRKGLKDGTIQLQKIDGMASVMGLLVVDPTLQDQEDMHAALDYARACGWLGEGSWIGWTIDMFNPAEDIGFVLDITFWLNRITYSSMDPETYREVSVPIFSGP